MLATTHGPYDGVRRSGRSWHAAWRTTYQRGNHNRCPVEMSSCACTYCAKRFTLHTAVCGVADGCGGVCRGQPSAGERADCTCAVEVSSSCACRYCGYNSRL